MFEGFEEQKDEQAKKRWLASYGTSFAIYAVLGVAVAIIAGRQISKAKASEPIDVSFHGAPEMEAAEPEPEPPPPPPVASSKPKKSAGKRALAEPTEVPDERPEEAAPTGSAPPAADEEEFGDGEGGEAGPAPPPAPPAPPPPPPPVEEEVRIPDPVEVADDVVPARARPGNTPPDYPEEQRRKGVEAEVILRVTISPSGDVINVVVLRGDEPFAGAAVTAVKTWRYVPAQLDGRPVEFARVVRIPFRIRT